LPSRNEDKNLKINITAKKSVPKLSTFQTIIAPANYKMKSVRYFMAFINDEPIKLTNWKENIKFKILGSVMNSKVSDLRFKKGAAVYRSAVGSRINKFYSWRELFLLLDCRPEEIDRRRKMVREMVNDVKTEELDKS